MQCESSMQKGRGDNCQEIESRPPSSEANWWNKMDLYLEKNGRCFLAVLSDKSDQQMLPPFSTFLCTQIITNVYIKYIKAHVTSHRPNQQFVLHTSLPIRAVWPGSQSSIHLLIHNSIIILILQLSCHTAYQSPHIIFIRPNLDGYSVSH